MGDPHASKSKRHWLTSALLLGVAAYLLVIVPTRAAIGLIQPEGVEWIVLLWMCLLFWLTTIVYTIASARALYGYPPIHVADTGEKGVGWKSVWKAFAIITQTITGRRALVVAIGSYFLSVYGFALLYVFISNRDPAAFSSVLSLTDSIYFSIISAATVGYGDIVPKSGLARLAVIIEILFTVFYGVFIFSIITAVMQRRGIG